MSYNLYIDDSRVPPRDGQKWHVAKSLEEAAVILRSNGAPKFISFDTDLGQVAGQQIASWLIQFDLNNNVLGPDFEFYVHTDDLVVATQLKTPLQKYLKFKFSVKSA
jgi:hypothetical protein